MSDKFANFLKIELYNNKNIMIDEDYFSHVKVPSFLSYLFKWRPNDAAVTSISCYADEKLTQRIPISTDIKNYKDKTVWFLAHTGEILRLVIY